MTSSRKTPGVAFWATVVVLCLPALYLLSAGPAQVVLIRQVPVRIVDSHGRPFTPPPSMSCGPTYDSELYSTIYAPIAVLAETPAVGVLTWYLGLFRDFIPFDSKRAPQDQVVEIFR
jgi:hypothetical protein